MNVFESLAVNDAFASALLAGMPITEEEAHEATQEDYRRIYNEACKEIAGVYEEGTGAFIREHHPELAEQIREAGDEIDAFWGADFERFEKAMGRWRDLYLKAVRLAAISRERS